ncbi:MAG: D-hexose-6-phosphate mutarotase [Gammaproteobacteria bacterium]|nr:MAG: D-hexose-6-phosphate mutarotase [Gammaproteobacteria bacterium]
MNATLIEQLNDEFSLQGDNNNLQFKKGKGDLPVVDIQNSCASACISLQGAHLLSWIPKDEEEVIWVSEDANFSAGKSVRGGVPICWPWFGSYDNTNNETTNNFPTHGFARTTNWQVLSTEALGNGSTRISFTTQPEEDTKAMWPPETSVQLKITIGKKLELELITHNDSATPITIGQAFHTYFNIGDITNTQLHGLDDTDYLDKADNLKRKVQHGPITIEEEVDRIYLDTTSDCVIEDKTMKRNIIIIKCGSHSTVVWNPWEEVAASMGDLGENGYTKMLCVESSNAAEDVATILPGKAHQLWVQYAVQRMC